MRAFSFIILLLIIGAPLAYAGYVLNDQSEVDPIVRLFGPGNQPSTCVARARPHFEKMEEVLTTAAQTLLTSENLSSVTLFSVGDPVFELENDAQQPTEEEKKFFTEAFKPFGRNNYYVPTVVHNIDGQVSALGGFCGISAFNWIKGKIGLSVNGRIVATAYIFWPEGVPEISPCSEPINPSADPVIQCEAELTPTWTWYAEWVDFTKLIEEDD